MSEAASERDDYDPRFSFTPIDEPAFTETGVMLMGLDADRLLAGLGMAALADDPAQVVLAVDRLRHGVTAALGFDALVDAGARRWRSAREAIDAAGPQPSPPVALRRAWDETLRLLTYCDLGDVGPATLAHLAACRLRRDEIDGRVGRPPVMGPAAAG
ncbi:DUF6187 family protein [Streptomyces sp. RerS4]|uniref:DUF6187 family protein n=1 Tax=Streptomyces sp. RerS4 TaxID=2942449 RepID=UPI00201C104B|nr:DUF6187 family protein [Streptomyces sp. RerS4]UQX00012.1 DUF6187 family protein [Streptomyces sp. RerS4]